MSGSRAEFRVLITYHLVCRRGCSLCCWFASSRGCINYRIKKTRETNNKTKNVICNVTSSVFPQHKRHFLFSLVRRHCQTLVWSAFGWEFEGFMIGKCWAMRADCFGCTNILLNIERSSWTLLKICLHSSSFKQPMNITNGRWKN